MRPPVGVEGGGLFDNARFASRTAFLPRSCHSRAFRSTERDADRALSFSLRAPRESDRDAERPALARPRRSELERERLRGDDGDDDLSGGTVVSLVVVEGSGDWLRDPPSDAERTRRLTFSVALSTLREADRAFSFTRLAPRDAERDADRAAPRIFSLAREAPRDNDREADRAFSRSLLALRFALEAPRDNEREAERDLLRALSASLRNRLRPSAPRNNASVSLSTRLRSSSRMRSSSRRLSSSSWRAERSAGLASPSLSLSCCFWRFCFCCFCCFCDFCCDCFCCDLLLDRERERSPLPLRLRLRLRDWLRDRELLREPLRELLRDERDELRDRPRELDRDERDPERDRERDPFALALPFRPFSPFVRPPLPPLPPSFGSLPFGSLTPFRLGSLGIATLSSITSSRLRPRYWAAMVACK